MRKGAAERTCRSAGWLSDLKQRGLLESSRTARRSGLRCDAGVYVTCRKCKVPMKELKGHIYHQQRKWKCPKCAKVRMQKQKEKFDL